MRRFWSTLVLNISFYTLFLAGSLVVIPTLTLVMVVQAPFMSHRAAMCRFRQYIKVYGRIVIGFARPLVKVDYEAEADTKPSPCIYICNHRSASDPFLMAFLPNEFVQVVNTWPFRLPVLGRFARWAGYLSIREMPAEAFFKRGGELIGQGISLVVFPEGTRSASRKMGPFHGAAFRLAQQCRTPLVPVCLTGNESIPRKGSLKLSPGRIRIRQLRALQPEAFEGMSPFALKKRVHGIIAEETARMEGCA